MIQTMHADDLDTLLQIWLDGNRQAHAFVPATYWEQHLPLLRVALPAAQVYVYEDAAGIQGFLGLQGDYIAGLFVRAAAQGRGIGTQLLKHAKATHPRLTLSVYEKNKRARAFYVREGFRYGPPQTTDGETEYSMTWAAP